MNNDLRTRKITVLLWKAIFAYADMERAIAEICELYSLDWYEGSPIFVRAERLVWDLFGEIGRPGLRPPTATIEVSSALLDSVVHDLMAELPALVDEGGDEEG